MLRWYLETYHNSFLSYLPQVMLLSKGKVVLVLFLTDHHSMKAYWGSGGIAPRILWGTRWRWVVSFTSQPLYLQRKSPWYPLDRRLGGPQSRSGHSGEEKIYPDHPTRSPALYHGTTPATYLLRAVTFEVLHFSSYALSPTLLPATVWNIFGSPVGEQLSVLSSLFFPDIFSIPKTSSLFARLYFRKQPEVIEPNQGNRVGVPFQ